MLCVTAMAKDGGHATCGVKRRHRVRVRRRGQAGALGRAKSAPTARSRRAQAQGGRTGRPSPNQPPAPRPPQLAAADPWAEAPPQTVLELAKRTNEKTAEQMKKAGDTVKEATKKTWDCMLSLFTRC